MKDIPFIRGFLALFIFLINAYAAFALDYNDLPGGSSATTDRNGIITDISFVPDDFSEKIQFKKVDEEEAWALFFAYLYFYPSSEHRKLPEWKEWADSAAAKQIVATIIATRIPKECAINGTDKQKITCWIKKLIGQRKIKLLVGHFAVENGKNVYYESSAEGRLEK